LKNEQRKITNVENQKEIRMNELRFKGTWNEVKGKIRQKYGELTDDDLAYTKGQDEELIGKIQKRLGKTRDEVRRILEEL
jgi:uncharacterized protein YjbJ (UPF0337 family)